MSFFNILNSFTFFLGKHDLFCCMLLTVKIFSYELVILSLMYEMNEANECEKNLCSSPHRFYYFYGSTRKAFFPHFCSLSRHIANSTRIFPLGSIDLRKDDGDENNV